MKIIQLLHPIHNCLAVAQVSGYWYDNGRNAGLTLHFPDGHTAALTYQEIRELQEAEHEN